jgi:hypothetical protein
MVAGAPRIVVLLVDGLGWNQLQAHSIHMPTLSSFTGGHITSITPSTTATALTSLVTGLAPGEHGLIGYRVDMGNTVMNVLRWETKRETCVAHSRLKPLSHVLHFLVSVFLFSVRQNLKGQVSREHI